MAIICFILCAVFQETRTECQTKQFFGLQYRGTKSTTISGKTCQHWKEKDGQVEMLPLILLGPYFSQVRLSEFLLGISKLGVKDIGDAENYCRNVIGDAMERSVWCFTSYSDWECCDVPLCNGKHLAREKQWATV